MDSLDIQIVDSLTVNLNQEDYSTEGQAQNNVDVYIEDEQQLFETALTQDSINLYTRETPDTIIFDAKEITDGISKLESQIEKTSKESTLTSGVNELKEAFANIDLSGVEQAIIDVKNAVTNIDFSALAKEETLTQVQSKVEEVGNKIDNIKLPEIDTTEFAKQGENQEATMSVVYDELMKLNGSYADQIKDIVGE